MSRILNSFMDAIWEEVDNQGFDSESVLGKENCVDNVHVRCAVSQLLYYRFELSQIRIAQILKRPKSHQIHFYVNKMDRRHHDDFNRLVDALDGVADRYEEHVEQFNIKSNVI